MKKLPPRLGFDGMDGRNINEIPGNFERAWISHQGERCRRFPFLQRLQGREVQDEVSDRAGTNNDYLQAENTNPMKSTMGAALDEYALDFGTTPLVQYCTVSGGIWINSKSVIRLFTPTMVLE